jgi:CarD family transcriptional regulator
MAFKVGQTVVYPHHGAALIEAITTRTIRGTQRQYLKLRVTQGNGGANDLTIEVPAENVDLVGVRDVVGKEGVKQVFEVLRANVREEPTNWSRRYKANVEKIASGDVIKVAEVVRDLSRRDTNRGLSAGEKRMLARARQILISELALAEGIDEDQATVTLDEVLATPLPPDPEEDSAIGESDDEVASEAGEEDGDQPAPTPTAAEA